MKSSAEHLRDLAELLDRGLISRDEFDAQKGAIIAQITGSAPRLGAAALPPSIGAYTILGLVGAGGMGVVYRGRHRLEARAKAQGGDVAIKVMHPQFARAEGFARRFEREANLGTRLDHPGIVRAYDLIVEGETLALIMELVEGQALSQMIGEQTGPLPWDRALPMFRQLLDAVGHAHAQGVVHRDLKPDNVMVTADGRLHVLDFGIAREQSSHATGTGLGMGTVAYMAPEQYRDARSVDARADIYALAMTLYEMLAGRLPWDAATSEFEILTMKAAGDLPPPTAYYPHIPAPIIAALGQALESDPDRRLPSTEAFAAVLDNAEQEIRAARERAAGALQQPKPAPTPVRRRRGCLLAFAIAAAVAMLAIFSLFLALPAAVHILGGGGEPLGGASPRYDDGGGGSSVAAGRAASWSPTLQDGKVTLKQDCDLYGYDDQGDALVVRRAYGGEMFVYVGHDTESTKILDAGGERYLWIVNRCAW